MKATLLSEKHMAFGYPAVQSSLHMDPADGSAVVYELVEDRRTHNVTVERNKAFVACLRGHTDQVVSGDFALSANVAATSSCDGTVRLWDMSTARCLCVLPNGVQEFVKVAISSDAKFVVTCAQRFLAHVWCGVTGAKLRDIEVGESHWSHHFSVDGRFFMCRLNVKTIRVWDVDVWDSPRDLTLPEEDSVILSVIFSDVTSQLVIVKHARRSTEHLIVESSLTSQVTVFCLRTGAAVQRFVEHTPFPRRDGSYAYGNNVLLHLHRETVTARCVCSGVLIGSFKINKTLTSSCIDYDGKLERAVVWDSSGRVLQYQLEFAHRDEIFACLAAGASEQLGHGSSSSSSTALSKFLKRDGDGRIVRNVFEWLRLF